MKTVQDYFQNSAKYGVKIVALCGVIFLAIGALLALFTMPDITSSSNNVEILTFYTLKKLPIMLILSGCMFIVISVLVFLFKRLPYRLRKMERTYSAIEYALDSDEFNEYNDALYYAVKKHYNAKSIPLDHTQAVLDLSKKVYAKTNVNFHHWGILNLVLENRAIKKGLI